MLYLLLARAQAGSVSVRAVTRSQRHPEQRRAGGCQHIHDGTEALRPPLHPAQRSRQTRPPESHQRGAHGQTHSVRLYVVLLKQAQTTEQEQGFDLSGNAAQLQFYMQL